MSKTTKRAIWAAWFALMCLVIYQVLGWLGVLFLVVGGAISGVTVIFINRKVRRDEQLSQSRRDGLAP